MRIGPLLTSFRGCKIKREFYDEVGELYRCSAQLGEAGQRVKTEDTISQPEGAFQWSQQRLLQEGARPLTITLLAPDSSEKSVTLPLLST